MNRKRGGLVWVVVFSLLLLYLLFWPVSPPAVEVFIAPEAPPLTGVYAQNEALQAVERLGEGSSNSPADLTFDSNGRVYVGMGDGRIVRFAADGNSPEVFVDTGGRPAGMVFDANGNLIVADAKLGLLSIAADGDMRLLASEAAGQTIGLANDVDIASDGTIYLSDYKFYADNASDFLDGRPLTRLLAYDPHTQTVQVVIEGLYSANGVALGPDDSFVLVGETMAYRIKRYWLSGPKAGQTDIFIENLPGFPDSIRFNGMDTFWLTLLGPRDPIKAFLQANPFWRAVLRRVPLLLDIAGTTYPKAYGFVLGLDSNGNVIENLQDPTGKYAHHISCAYEHEGTLYLGTISDKAFYRIAAP